MCLETLNMSMENTQAIIGYGTSLRVAPYMTDKFDKVQLDLNVMPSSAYLLACQLYFTSTGWS